MIVLDASAAIELLLVTPAGLEVGRRVFAPRETLHAPELLDLEVAQVLRRYTGNGDLSGARGAEALQDLADLAIERYPHAPLMPRVWELRANLTAYDAAYVSLAELLGAPLLTCDRRLHGAPHEARIEVVGGT